MSGNDAQGLKLAAPGSDRPGTRVRKPLRQSRVPTSRIERLARVGWLAGELAMGALAEGLRRVTGVQVARNLVLSEANAQRLAKRLSRLRGAAMKLGQMLSLQGEDLLPAEVARALSILRAEANAMPQAQLRRALAREYGASWEGQFRDFDPNPIAAASIGQVHRATALDGRRLALKIQYPGVARSINSDVENVAAVLRLARLVPGDADLSELLAEAKRQLRRETDYRIEANLQSRYRTLVAEQTDLVVPQVHDDLATAHILAMDFVDGVPLADVCDTHPQRLRNRIGTLLYDLALRELLDFRFLQSDPNFANYLFLPATRQLGLLDFGGTRELPPVLTARYARLLQAVADADQLTLRATLEEIGLLRPDDPEDRVRLFVELFLIGFEPFRYRGGYDFAASSAPLRVREVGFELAFGKGFFRPPPPDIVFVHRKLAGMFLLCARLRARVNVRALLTAALDRVREGEGSGVHASSQAPRRVPGS
jgi:predicted unusual protein kinase regulating ubiquinone biosynthesis (AarF/ABC1/UbiB family)